MSLLHDDLPARFARVRDASLPLVNPVGLWLSQLSIDSPCLGNPWLEVGCLFQLGVQIEASSRAEAAWGSQTMLDAVQIFSRCVLN